MHVTDRSHGSFRDSRLSAVLKRIAAIVVVVGLLAWVVWGAWGDARRIEWHELELHGGLIALSGALLGLAFVWHAVVWVLMMRLLGYRLAWLPGVRAAVASQLGNYIPGKIFIVVFRVQVAARYGVPKVPVVGTIALEALLRNLMATMLAGLGLYYIGVGTSYMLALAILAVVSVFFASPRVFHGIADWVLRKTGRPPLPRRLTAPQVLALLGCYLVYWAMYVGAFYLMLAGTFGTEPSALPWLATAVFVSQLGSTLAVFAPVGVGVAEAGIAGVLALTDAVSAPYMVAVVTRVWRTIFEMAQIGLVWLIPLPPPEPRETDAPGPDRAEGADISGASPPGSGGG